MYSVSILLIQARYITDELTRLVNAMFVCLMKVKVAGEATTRIQTPSAVLLCVKEYTENFVEGELIKL